MAVLPRDPMVAPPPQPVQTPEQLRAATREAFNKLLNPAGKLDLSNPEATIRSFAWSFFNADFKTARECIQNAQPYEKLIESEKLVRREFLEDQRGGGHVMLTDMRSYVVGENAAVTLCVLFIADQNAGVPTNILTSLERFDLKKVGNNWLIVGKYSSMTPATTEQFTVILDDALTRTVALFTHPANALKTEFLTQCQNNLKQISLGVMQFVQDWNEKFDLHADWKNQLLPYLKTEAVFHCPELKWGEESYAFNSELENKLLGNIGQAANTIMIYEGKEQKFDFRHQNGTMTNIAFADGHVKAYTKQVLDEAMKAGTVRWKP